MAEQSMGRRVVVQDPLAPNVQANTPDRSVGTLGVRPVRQGPGDGWQDQATGLQRAMGGLSTAVSGVLDQLKDDALAKGKMDFMAGVSEESVIKSGDMYRQQGWKAMSIADEANNWFTNETLLLDIDSPNTLAGMEPAEYQNRLNTIRAEAAGNITDPELRKVYVASWEDKGPRLAAMQVKNYAEYNRKQNNTAFGNMLGSAAATNSDSQVNVIGDAVTGLRVSSAQVSPDIKYSAQDRDIGIRTLLGEAASEGPEGLAAVAHVLKNRAYDGSYGGKSIASVALAEKQFSAWNSGAGGNNPSKWNPESRQYKEAGAVFDAVMQGKHVDPTGGATHYYSPSGMALLKKQGVQSNTIPGWFPELSTKHGATKIGGHIFTGRANGLPDIVASALGPVDAETVTVAGVGSMPNDVAATMGVPQAPTVPRASQLQQQIMAAPGRNEDKVLVLGNQMIQNFQNGDPTLFNDSGGYSILKRLGAPADVLNKVEDAERAYKQQSLNKFNVEQEKWEASVLNGVERGELTYDQAMEQINSKYKNSNLNDAMAKSLAEKVRAADVRAGRKTVDNPELLNRMSYLYAAVANGSLSVEDAQGQTMMFADQFNVPVTDINQFIGKLAGEHEGRIKALDQAAARASEKKAQNDAALGAVDRAIATGIGLSALRGSVTMTDDNGVERSMSLTEVGVQKIKAETIAEYKNKAPQYNAMYGESANAKLLNDAQLDTYSRLRQQNVVDEQTQAEYSAAVAGELVDAGGNINPKALEAADFYIRMAQSAKVGDEYMAKMFPDQGTRATFNMIQSRMSGGETIDTAVRKTDAALNKASYDVAKQLDRNSKFYSNLDEKVGAEIAKTAGRDGILARLFNTSVSERQVDAVISRNMNTAENWVKDQAQRIYAANPGVSEEAAIKTATQELSKRADILGGNLLIASNNQTKLSTVMGLDSYGPTAAQDVVHDYIKSQGPKLLDQVADDAKNLPPDVRAQIEAGLVKPRTLWDMITQKQKTTLGLDGIGAGLGELGSMNVPEYYAQYLANGTIRLQFYTDATRSELVGPAINIPAAELGARWKAKQNADANEAYINRAWNWISTGVAGNAQAVSEDLNTDVPAIMNMGR